MLTPTLSSRQCSDLTTAGVTAQVQIVEGNTACAQIFIELLKSHPSVYLAAFYALVSSQVATDASWVLDSVSSLKNDWHAAI